jgi:hypothetical protein
MTLLGGINMVDYDPWRGNYTETVVRNNTIYGGFATGQPTPGESKGINPEDAIIKLVASKLLFSLNLPIL